MSNPPRRVLLAVLALAVLAAIGYYFRNAVQSGFNWTRVADAIEHIRLGFVLASVAVIFMAYAVRAVRWQRFCRWLGRCSFVDTYNATLMGFAGVCLLSRAGEPLRPVLLARRCRLPVATMFGIWLLERLFDLGSAAVVLTLSLLLPSQLLSAGGGAAGWEDKIRIAGVFVAAGLAGAVALVTYFRVHGAGLIDRRLAVWCKESGWRRRLAKLCGDFGEGVQAIRSFPDLAAAVFYSLLHWGLITVVYYLVVRSFGGRMGQFDLRGAMLLLIITLFGSLLQLPGVGGGTQIFAFIGLTQIFGIEQEPAAAAAMLLWIINAAVVCLPGVPLLIHEGWSMTSLRRLARDEVEAEKAGAHVSATSNHLD
jgi:uncharacterized protein (TIRG00374 family)